MVSENGTDVELLLFIEGVNADDSLALCDATFSRMAPEDLEYFLRGGACPLTISNATTLDLVRVEASYVRPPMCLRALVREELRFGQTQPGVGADYVKVVETTFKRFLEACVLAVGQGPVLIAWRQRLWNSLLRGSWATHVLNAADRDRRVMNIAKPEELSSIYVRLKMAEECSAPVRIAAGRLGLAKARETLDDRLIDAVIALEALLLSDQKHDRSELSLRAALRAAHWASDAALGVKPIMAFDIVRAAYSRRSALVHGGAVSALLIRVGESTVSLERLVKDTESLVSAMVISALEDLVEGTSPREWDERLRKSLRQ